MPLPPLPGFARWITAALDSADDGILIESREKVVYVNASYARLLGYRGPTDLIRRSVAELVADCDADRLRQFGRRRVEGKPVPASYDFVARRSDGSTIRLQASVSTSICEGTPYIMTIVRPFGAGIDESYGGPLAGPHDALSPREMQIMEMLLAGKRAKAIALELMLTENTVATHRTRLLEKMGISDNRELYQYALRHRLVDWS